MGNMDRIPITGNCNSLLCGFKGSKSFFDKYKRVFDLVKEAVKGFGSSEEEQDRRHLFTQRLFNRPMFLRLFRKRAGSPSTAARITLLRCGHRTAQTTATESRRVFKAKVFTTPNVRNRTLTVP
jgi:hypothetical protein